MLEEIVDVGKFGLPRYIDLLDFDLSMAVL